MSVITFLASPFINFAFEILFICLFIFALFIASSFISTPNTCLQYLLRYNPIVPVPQYRSSILSPLDNLARFFICSYSFNVCFVFTWKKEVGDIINFKLFKYSSIWPLPFNICLLFIMVSAFIFLILSIVPL